jgi:chromosomal replication initiation ATPase DnaA
MIPKSANIMTITYLAYIKHERKGFAYSYNEDRVKEILETVAATFRITVEDLTGLSRKPHFTYPRYIAMYTIRMKTTFSLRSIGKLFNRVDHSSACTACKTVNGYLRSRTPDFIEAWELFKHHAPDYLICEPKLLKAV